MPDRRQLLLSLQSEVCPACGGPKQRRHTLCRPDFHKLPRRLQCALYDLMGRGYEDAVSEALLNLNATEFILPDSASAPSANSALKGGT